MRICPKGVAPERFYRGSSLSFGGFFQADDRLHLFQCCRIIISLPTAPANPGRDVFNDDEPAFVAVLDGFFFCVHFSIAVLIALVFHISPLPALLPHARSTRSSLSVSSP